MLNKYFLALVVSVVTLHSGAQKNQLFAGNVPAQNAIELKWLGSDVKKDASYDLYRRETGGSWQKINSTPIKRVTPLTEAEMKKEAEKPQYDEALLIYSAAFMKGDDGVYDPQMDYFVLTIVSATQNNIARYMGQYYLDNGVTAGKSYEYRLSLAGKPAEASIASATITSGTYQQPAAPVGFAVMAKDKRIELKWTPEKSFSQYSIYRSVTAGGKAEDTISALLSEQQVKDAAAGKYFYEDKDSMLHNGKTYYYKICGLDFFGHVSKISAEVSATPVDQTAPGKVFGFKTELVGKSIRARWWVSKDADCVGYNLYKSQEAKTGFVKVNTSLIAKKDSMLTDSQVKENEKYYYYLEAVDKNGNGSKTDVVSFEVPDMTPPEIPTGLAAKTDTGKIVLSWNKNTESDLAGYYVFRALKDRASDFQLQNNEPLKGNSYLDTLPKKAGNSFLYRVCSVDKNYNRSQPSAFISAKMPDIVAPEAVVLVSAEWKDLKVKLEWLPNHQRDLKGYEVWRADADTANRAVNAQKISPALVGGKTVVYYDDKVPAGKNLLYYVICVDSANNRSVASNKKMFNTGMQRVDNKPVTNLRGVYDAASKTINLTWTESTAPVDGYKVFRKKGAGNFVPVSGVGKGTSFSDKEIEEGNTYSYKILSVSGTGFIVYSAEAKVEVK